jgi:hypothetical protein
MTAMLGAAVHKDYMDCALASGASRADIVREWLRASLCRKYQLIRQYGESDAVMGDADMTSTVLALLGPTFAEQGADMHIRTDAACGTLSGFCAALFEAFARDMAIARSHKMCSYSRDSSVRSWLWGHWTTETKHQAMRQYAESGELCCDWFNHPAKKGALLSILDPEFAKAGVDVAARFDVATAAGTAADFWCVRTLLSGPVLCAEFVQCHRAHHGAEECSARDVVAQWAAAGPNSALKLSWIWRYCGDLSSGDLSFEAIREMLEVEFLKASA